MIRKIRKKVKKEKDEVQNKKIDIKIDIYTDGKIKNTTAHA